MESLIEKREVINSGFLILYVVGFVALSVFLGLFLGRGYEVPIYRERAVFYNSYLIIFTVGIVALGIIGVVIKKWGKSLYASYGWLGCAIAEPEEGFLWQIPSKWLRRNLSRFWPQFLFGIIIFSLLGLVSTTQNTFINELPFSPFTQETVTAGGQIVNEVEPASTTETLILMFFDGLIFAIAIWLRTAKGWSETASLAFKLLTFPLSIAVWLAFHFLVYNSSELALTSVAFFAFITTLLYVLTGGILYPTLYHQSNNLFLILSKLYQLDQIQVITTVIILVSIALLVFLTIIQKKEKPLLEVNANG